MSEEHVALRATLSRLHEQLADHELDAQERALLDGAVHEIEAALGRDSDSDEPSLAERFDGLGAQFENSHPKLAEAVARVVDALANLGI